MISPPRIVYYILKEHLESTLIISVMRLIQARDFFQIEHNVRIISHSFIIRKIKLNKQLGSLKLRLITIIIVIVKMDQIVIEEMILIIVRVSYHPIVNLTLVVHCFRLTLFLRRNRSYVNFLCFVVR